MSRSGYSDECEGLALYRANVDRSLAGKRGQRALTDVVKALDAMPEKRLVAHSFSCADGVCTLGALADHRGVSVEDFNLVERDYYDEPVDSGALGRRFDIAPMMAAEIMYLNDEWDAPETAEQRHARMRDWAASRILPAKKAAS